MKEPSVQKVNLWNNRDNLTIFDYFCVAINNLKYLINHHIHNHD